MLVNDSHGNINMTTTESTPVSFATCPKKMTFGPCADVGLDGSCEVPERHGGPGACVFIDEAPRFVRSGALTHAGTPVVASKSPLVLSELPETTNSSVDLRRIARRFVGSVDAVLFGDSNWQRVRFPPSYRARVLHDEGLGAWPGINCRDRNCVALEGELLALADVGVAGVHCVTGNHPHSGHRPDAAGVFDLDSTRLTELAAGAGLRVSVAASPHTPPTHLRAMRTADKAAAGAAICMVDQPSDVSGVEAFIAETRGHGAHDLIFLPVITVVFETDDFERWSQYPNARIPTGWGDELIGARNVGAVGRRLALAFARQLLTVDGVGGVVFGSTADPSRSDEVADAFASLATELRSAPPVSP